MPPNAKPLRPTDPSSVGGTLARKGDATRVPTNEDIVKTVSTRYLHCAKPVLLCFCFSDRSAGQTAAILLIANIAAGGTRQPPEHRIAQCTHVAPMIAFCLFAPTACIAKIVSSPSSTACRMGSQTKKAFCFENTDECDNSRCLSEAVWEHLCAERNISLSLLPV